LLRCGGVQKLGHRSAAGVPDNLDQRIVQDAQQLATSMGTVLFGGEGRISLLQVPLT
jgi:hypothetical protein